MDLHNERKEVLEARLSVIVARVRDPHTDPKMLHILTNEAYRIRQELSRRSGDVPKAVDVNFEKYITK